MFRHCAGMGEILQPSGKAVALFTGRGSWEEFCALAETMVDRLLLLGGAISGCYLELISL